MLKDKDGELKDKDGITQTSEAYDGRYVPEVSYSNYAATYFTNIEQTSVIPWYMLVHRNSSVVYKSMFRRRLSIERLAQHKLHKLRANKNPIQVNNNNNSVKQRQKYNTIKQH